MRLYIDIVPNIICNISGEIIIKQDVANKFIFP